MLRKALIFGMVFILALSLLAVSMITCFTYNAEAHDWTHPGVHWDCVHPHKGAGVFHDDHPGGAWDCDWETH